MSSETLTRKLQLPSCEHLSQMFNFSKRKSTIPKVPSNLVISDTSNACNQAHDKKKLESFIAESEKNLVEAKNDYEKNYDKFLALTHNFHREKLKNLKLTFKNQILKQQIYFESELMDLAKEYVRDFEAVAPKTTSRNSSKHGKEQHAIKMFREEMKKLTEYMRESLLNTSDTLIETFETCEILKRINEAESSCLIQQQHNQNDDLDDELIEIKKYQAETENLMLILDEIELQYLERKNFLHSKKKFINKLKSKLKSIEEKYENLSKSVNNLKYESYVYKQLWLEKQRSQNEKSASLLTKSISRSSSASSLSDTNPNSTSSSSSINCASDYDEDLDDLDDLSQDKKDESTYNRKLTIISNLIDLHKAKSTSKDLWHVKNSKSIETHQASDLEIIVCESEPDTLYRQSSSLDLRDCSTDGGKVVVENCSLKLDRDISNWFITRQIDDMSVFKYRLPSGSIIKCGKELRIPTPFRNNELQFLMAIKQKLSENERYSKLKIRTKLVSPEGIVKAVHIQEVPQFYHEIFKYASLIQFL